MAATPEPEATNLPDFREIYLSSYGLGSHLHALDLLVNNRQEEIPRDLLNGITMGMSNFLTGSLYVQNWLDKASESHLPKNLSDLAPDHIQLLSSYLQVYTGLRNSRTRLMLNPAKGISIEELMAPIDEIEFQQLWETAKSDELISYSEMPMYHADEAPESMLIDAIMTRKIIPTPKFIENMNAVNFDARLRSPQIKAGLLMLGSFLAVAEQLSFDHKQQAQPVSKDYRPLDLENDWQSYFPGQLLPTVAELLTRAQAMLADLYQKYHEQFPEIEAVEYLLGIDPARNLS